MYNRKKIISLTIRVLLLSFSLSYVLYQGNECFRRFSSNPEAVDQSFKFQGLLPFPALTICPRAQYKIQSKLGPFALKTDECNITKTGWMELFWALNDSKCQGKNLVDKAFSNFEDFGIHIVAAVNFKGQNAKSSQMKWIPTLQVGFGRCFSLTFSDDFLKDGVQRVIIVQGLKDTELYLHSRGALRNPAKGVGLAQTLLISGQIAIHQLKHEFIHFLHFGEKPCNDEEDYNLDECIIKNVDETMLNQIGCTTIFGNHPDMACKDPKLAEIAHKFHLDEVVDSKTCKYPCRFLSNSFISKSVEQRGTNQTITDISFQEYVKSTRSHYIYNAINLIAELGGYVGLFLGYSFLNIGDVMDWILDLRMRI